jgi:hypothetical protein
LFEVSWVDGQLQATRKRAGSLVFLEKCDRIGDLTVQTVPRTATDVHLESGVFMELAVRLRWKSRLSGAKLRIRLQF